MAGRSWLGPLSFATKNVTSERYWYHGISQVRHVHPDLHSRVADRAASIIGAIIVWLARTCSPQSPDLQSRAMLYSLHDVATDSVLPSRRNPGPRADTVGAAHVHRRECGHQSGGAAAAAACYRSACLTRCRVCASRRAHNSAAACRQHGAATGQWRRVEQPSQAVASGRQQHRAGGLRRRRRFGGCRQR